MNALLKIIIEILKKIGPELIGSAVSALMGTSSTKSIIKGASHDVRSEIEWIEAVREETGATGSGDHPLDRLVESAIKSEEASARARRGLRGAANVTLGIIKKVVL